MANGGNRTIAPVRKLIAVVLGTVAAFVVLFGLGMTSWAIVALGVALVVLAVALGTVRGGGRTWVVGVGHVHSASEPPTQYAFGRCELQLVIDAPGLPPRSKKIIEPRVPVAKWPSLGQTLPIRVALDDQRHVRVLWDEVPTHTEAATGVTDLPPEYADAEPLDDMLIQQEAPPWAGRTADDDFHDEFRDDLREPPPADPVRAEPLRPESPHPDPVRAEPLRDDVEVLTDDEREPVVVHQRPGGPVVLEGTLVEQPTAGQLPRRATAPTTAGTASAATAGTASAAAGTAAGTATAAPAPRPPAEERFDAPILDPVDVPLDAPTTTGDGRLDPDLDEAIFGYDPAAATAGGDDAAGPISGVGLTLLVTDLSRSLDFYRDLGFEEFDRGAGNAVLASGQTRLVLREVTGAAPISRRLVHVNLEVDDIETAYRRLKDTGVRFTYAPRVVNRGTRLEVWAAAFRDPDGHGIALTQWRERAEA
ncbi:VOC family protein [Micromonospora sp. WMMD734]|uniref:VOC family protein n=1 Tax=Micromonospora humidisoli TaxID=2807622 RepID=A0ABS2JDV7_9ACTN|nr:VOC family protein [Micromonospora humidisoli]MBM7084549.1 VOC family protein [Micromonospora humidisoli]